MSTDLPLKTLSGLTQRGQDWVFEASHLKVAKEFPIQTRMCRHHSLDFPLFPSCKNTWLRHPLLVTAGDIRRDLQIWDFSCSIVGSHQAQVHLNAPWSRQHLMISRFGEKKTQIHNGKKQNSRSFPGFFWVTWSQILSQALCRGIFGCHGQWNCWNVK